MRKWRIFKDEEGPLPLDFLYMIRRKIRREERVEYGELNDHGLIGLKKFHEDENKIRFFK